MNSYKELWIKTNQELYEKFLEEGFNSDTAQRRADLLTDEETLDKYTSLILSKKNR